MYTGKIYKECPFALQQCCYEESSAKKPCEQQKSTSSIHPSSFKPTCCTYSIIQTR